MGNSVKFTQVWAFTIDGERYFVDSGRDLSPQEKDTISKVKTRGMQNVDGSPRLSRNEPPREYESQSEIWTGFIDVLESRLRPLQVRTIVIDAARFVDRAAEALKGIQPVPLQQYGNSTHRLEPDDGKNASLDPLYATAYAKAYGVDLSKATPLPYTASVSRACNPTDSWKRRIVYATSPLAGLARYDCNRPHRVGPPLIMGIALAFLKKYQANIDAAVAILAANHPKLHANNIKLFFTHLILDEFMFFNDVDLGQDIAAGKYAGIPQAQQDRIEKNAPNTLYTVATWLPGGSALWRAYGWLRDAPPVIQGFGPLQIIPGVALWAARNPALFKSYAPTLSAADFRDEQSVIRAILDPEKMFAVKAMTWDLQLRELEKTDPDLVPSIRASPYIVNKETARELILLIGASELIQFPENVDGIQSRIPDSGVEPILHRLYIMGDMLGISPQLDGIRVMETGVAAMCPDMAFSTVQKPDGAHICLMSELH